MRDRTAGIVVIGNEILSGKVTDSNSPFLVTELRKLGVTVRRVTTVPDEIEDIAATVRWFHESFDLVFTSGGVGPTHDDVTIEGIARGLGRRVIRHPEIEAALRRFYKDEVNDARLKMSEVPEGAELLHDTHVGFPTIKLDNIYILPGIPEILRAKFLALADRFAADPYHLRVIYTRQGEGTIAEYLNQAMAEFPDLMLGSYPKIGDPEYAVKLTMESKDGEYVQRAFDRLIALLPAGSVVRTE